MAISEKSPRKTESRYKVIEDISLNPAYRSSVEKNNKYTWHIVYKHSDLLISSDKDIGAIIEEPLKEIYSQLEFCIRKDPQFLKSLVPLAQKSYYPEAIKKMCRLSSEFNVGPMAAVAGIVNDFLSQRVEKLCSYLVIENGGDIYAKSGSDLKIGIYAGNNFFSDKIVFKINSSDMPCGICSSSGTFGHSLSLGKCDLAVIISGSPVSADAAATAAANSVKSEEDIGKSIDYFYSFKSVLGILLIKNKKIGIKGNLQLLKF